MNKQFAGVFCAVWTPFKGGAALDLDALQANLKFVLGHGAHGIMALGSTADFPHLASEQRKTVLEVIARAAQGRPIIANVSDIRLREAIDLGLHAKASGAAAISLLPPWFYPMEQDDIAEFFVRAAEAVQLPLAIYNFPERTGKKVELETIRKVADRVRVCVVKQSGSDFEYHHELAALAREKGFALLTGTDIRFAEASGIGASGTVSGLANAVPDVLVTIYTALAHGASQSVRSESAFMSELGKKMPKLPFSLNVRAAMEARGLATGDFKYPLSAATQEKYAAFVQELKEFFRAHRLPYYFMECVL
jgi:4-hydroxy-tetrahydrodipicolinate synthase